MFQKCLLAILALTVLYTPAFAADLPFTDVPKSVSWYRDLENMYHAGVVTDNQDHLFKPDGLLARDEFLSIVVGVGCKKCAYPTIQDILKYQTSPFIDVTKQNSNYYCISYAKEEGIVQGYALDSSGKVQCQDKKQIFTSIPFCPLNSITRIEATVVLLRQANLWNEALNSVAFEKKRTIADVDDYWYGYAQKALETGLVEISSDNKIQPNQYLTRREFVIMAGKILHMNLCEIKPDIGNSKNNTYSAISIFDKGATSGVSNLAETKFLNRTETTYDLKGIGGGIGSTYNWELKNTTTGEIKQASGQYLDNYNFGTPGTWITRLTVVDPIGNAAESYAQVVIESNTGSNDSGNNFKQELSVAIRGNVMDGASPLPVDLSSIISGGSGSYSYAWDFGDGSYSNGSQVSHTFERPGIYTVTLVVRDTTTGSIGFSQVVIRVIESPDIDGDGVLNTSDLCPAVFGSKNHSGCPWVDEYQNGSGGLSGSGDTLKYRIGIDDKCLLDKVNDHGGIRGSLQCVSCPCSYTFDFESQIRSCDIIFPSILSSDKKSLYSRGGVYQIK